MWRTYILSFVLGITFGLALVGAVSLTTSMGTPAVSVDSPFVYTFNSAGILKESSSMGESSSPYFWLNSGGELRLSGYTGSTIVGDLPESNTWNKLYAASSAVDTDQGDHPQNLFRLVTRNLWENVRAEAQFLILEDRFSSSPNQNSSNGLLLMSRYKDSDTLYYAGIRVDGTAVIKKKYNGTYYTMAQKKVFPGTYSGSKDDVNLIPHREWLMLRSETVTQQDGSVVVKLYYKKRAATAWTKLLEAKDTGNHGGTPPITGKGYAGIRTDFMDVRFEDMRLETL